VKDQTRRNCRAEGQAEEELQFYEGKINEHLREQEQEGTYTVA